MRTVNNFPVPETPEEIMEFIDTNFNSVKGAGMMTEGWKNATEDTIISLTVHDLLSAFSWWLEVYGLE